MKLKKFLIAFLLLIACLIVFSVLLLAIANRENNKIENSAEELKEKPLYGISGYTPSNFPNSNVTEIQNFWADIKSYTQVYGVHVDWKDTKVLDTASRQTNKDIELVLGIQDPAEWVNSKEQYIAKSKQLLSQNKNIKYFAIGNEVDMLYVKYSNQFDSFVNLYNDAYSEIKESFPDVKIYTVFQYEHLKGDGYLLGKKDERSDLFVLISKFKKLDLIGITTYPYFDYQNPDQIPSDYFDLLKNYSEAKIAITETGWPAKTRFGGKLESLNNQGFVGSEEEQVQYLDWLLTFKSAPDQFEYINWIFVNDVVQWSDGTASTGFELFDSIGLKNHEGTPKLVWKKWVEVVK